MTLKQILDVLDFREDTKISIFDGNKEIRNGNRSVNINGIGKRTVDQIIVMAQTGYCEISISSMR